MEVNIAKLTDLSLAQEAAESTMLGDKECKLSLEQIYSCGHSMSRTQLFWVQLTDIYSYVSTHLVRHNIGVTHFVSSRRVDRGGSIDDGRYSLVKHSMLINADALMNIAHARLCFQASIDTTRVMLRIREEVALLDPSLAKYMVPNCIYRQGCHELKSCGYWEAISG